MVEAGWRKQSLATKASIESTKRNHHEISPAAIKSPSINTVQASTVNRGFKSKKMRVLSTDSASIRVIEPVSLSIRIRRFAVPTYKRPTPAKSSVRVSEIGFVIFFK